MEIFTKSQVPRAIKKLDMMNAELKKEADPKYSQYVLVAIQGSQYLAPNLNQLNLTPNLDSGDFNIATMIPVTGTNGVAAYFWQRMERRNGKVIHSSTLPRYAGTVLVIAGSTNSNFPLPPKPDPVPPKPIPPEPPDLDQ